MSEERKSEITLDETSGALMNGDKPVTPDPPPPPPPNEAEPPKVI